jgi:hypothetical protein
LLLLLCSTGIITSAVAAVGYKPFQACSPVMALDLSTFFGQLKFLLSVGKQSNTPVSE